MYIYTSKLITSFACTLKYKATVNWDLQQVRLNLFVVLVYIQTYTVSDDSQVFIVMLTCNKKNVLFSSFKLTVNFNKMN